MSEPTQPTRAELLAQLQAHLREPFAAELAKWLAAAPDEASLKAWSAKNCDRWSQGIGTLARAAGFSEKHEVVAGSLVERMTALLAMSDAELGLLDQQRKAERAREAGAAG